MKPGDLIAYKEKHVPEGHTRNVIMYLGSKERKTGDGEITEHYVIVGGKKGRLMQADIDKCEVISKYED